jgi:hypothetical protein
LVELGVPVEHKDLNGNTALDKARLYEQSEVIKYLEGLDKNLNKEMSEVWKNKKFNEKNKMTIWILKKLQF